MTPASDSAAPRRGAPLRIAVLTTDTPHHRYFLRRLWREIPPAARVVLNLFETRAYPWRRNARRHLRRELPNLWRAAVLNPYFQAGSDARRMEALERPRFFPDGSDALPAALESHAVHSVNDPQARELLEKARPEVILIYGTGLVKPGTYRIASRIAVNAHGGKVPGYRGLDTNLWAALEGRPERMSVTLHEVDEQLDTGPILLERSLGPRPDLDLYSLRYHTAVLTTDLFVELVRALVEGPVRACPQDRSLASRYYGPMPWLLKRRAHRILRRYARTATAEGA